MAVFNPELVSGIHDDHVALAHMIAEYVDGDTSQPEFPKLRDGWRSDLAVRELEGDAGQKGLRWTALEDVYRQTLEFIQSPSGYALILLSRMYAERKKENVVGGISANWELVKELIEDADRRIAALEESNRKKRLESLSDFHHGIIARYIGDYDRAIFEQVKDAEKCEAMGDYVGASIAHLSAMVERCNKAIVEGADVPLGALHTSALEVAACCTGDDNTQKSWKYGSAPMHVLSFAIWGLRKLSLSSERYWMYLLTEELPRVDPERFATYEPVIVSIRAGLAMLHNQRKEAYRLANEVETQMTDRARPEAWVTARWVLAVLAADEHLEMIANEGVYMHQLRGRARDILAGITRQWCTVHADHPPLAKSA